MQQDDASIIGSIYDQFGDYYHRSRRKVAGRFANECIDVPAVLSLMPEDLSGKRVLDAGCGSGIYAQMIASRGASVTGVDASSKMIEIAEQEKPIDLEITYKVGDIGNLAFPDAAFDLVVCTYVLDNVGNLKSVFQEFHRLLKNQGICIFSISHPLRAQAARDALEGQEVWMLRDYFDRRVRQSDFGNGMVVPKYSRPLEDYTEAVVSTGFVITRLLEPEPIPEGETMNAEEYAKATRLPQLLVMRLMKAGTSG